ncbi:hypothetical protein KC906_02235, partial [Candidatus Kaiserbacteria bacterium]|nr:hypothetical protein [Candidatus Kaiserbacteria bacterium]
MFRNVLVALTLLVTLTTPALAQEADVPAYVLETTTYEQLEALTPEQQQVVREYYDNLRASKGRTVTVVATVEFDDVKVVRHEGNEVDVTFTLLNGKGAQPDMRYKLDLIYDNDGNDAPVIIDTMVYPEVLSVSEGETLVQNVTYTAPAYLTGVYQLYLTVENSSGLTLAIGTVEGYLELEGTGEYVNLAPGNCYLAVSGTDEQFDLEQGVDVMPGSDTITAHCEVQSFLGTEQAIYPVLGVRERSMLGDVVAPEQILQSAVVTAPAEGSFSFSAPLTIPADPQSYDATLYFQNSAGAKISNTIPLHFVVQGLSATIQNVVLNADAYKAGDEAVVQFTWSGSAGSFEGARYESIGLDDPRVVLQVADHTGITCSAEQSFPLTEGEQVVNLRLPIASDCAYPLVSAYLYDGTTLLDTKELSFGTPEAKPASLPAGDDEEESAGIVVTVLLLILLLVAVVGVVWYLKQSEQGGGDDDRDEASDSDGQRGQVPPVGMALLFLGVLLTGFSLPAGEAQAVTIFISDYTAQDSSNAQGEYEWKTHTYTLQTGLVYQPGDPILVEYEGVDEQFMCDNIPQDFCNFIWTQLSTFPDGEITSGCFDDDGTWDGCSTSHYQLNDKRTAGWNPVTQSNIVSEEDCSLYSKTGYHDGSAVGSVSGNRVHVVTWIALSAPQTPGDY